MKTNKRYWGILDNQLIMIPAGTRVGETQRPDFFKILDLTCIPDRLLSRAMKQGILIHENYVTVIENGKLSSTDRKSGGDV